MREEIDRICNITWVIRSVCGNICKITSEIISALNVVEVTRDFFGAEEGPEPFNVLVINIRKLACSGVRNKFSNLK